MASPRVCQGSLKAVCTRMVKRDCSLNDAVLNPRRFCLTEAVRFLLLFRTQLHLKGLIKSFILDPAAIQSSEKDLIRNLLIFGSLRIKSHGRNQRTIADQIYLQTLSCLCGCPNRQISDRIPKFGSFQLSCSIDGSALHGLFRSVIFQHCIFQSAG